MDEDAFDPKKENRTQREDDIDQIIALLEKAGVDQGTIAMVLKVLKKMEGSQE